MIQIQQGDVILEKIENIPAEAKKQDHLILAEGAATGHSHVSSAGLLFLLGEEMFLEAEVVTTIRHQEHDQVTLQPGKYKVGIVREYDPFLEETRRVVD